MNTFLKSAIAALGAAWLALVPAQAQQLPAGALFGNPTGAQAPGRGALPSVFNLLQTGIANTAASNSDYFLQLRNTSAGSSATTSLILGNDSDSGRFKIILNSSANTSLGGGDSVNFQQDAFRYDFYTAITTLALRIDTTTVTVPGALAITGATATSSVNATRSDGNYMYRLTGSATGQVSYGFAVTGSGQGSFTLDEIGVASRLSIAKTTGAVTIPNTLALTPMTAGSVLFAGASGVISQDNANFAWSAANRVLTLKTPNAVVEGSIPTATSLFIIDGSSGTPATADAATLSVSRRENINVTTNNAAAAFFHTTGTGSAQPVGVYGSALNTGTGDAAAVMGIASVTGTAAMSAFGAYFEARALSATTGSIAVETTTINNSGFDRPYSPVIGANLAIGFDIDGGSSGANLLSAAIQIRASSKWDVGVGFMQCDCIRTASIQDDTNSVTLFLAASGSHTDGIKLTGATFSGNPFASTGFSVNATGVVTGTRLVANPAAASTAAGLTINQSGPVSYSSTSDLHFNSINISSDQSAISAPGHSAFGFYTQYQTGGSSALGSKYAIRGLVWQQTASTLLGDLVGVSGIAFANSSGGGSGTLYGMEAQAIAAAGALNYDVVSGIEFNAVINTGGSANHRWGLSIVGNGVGRGSLSDAAIHISTVFTAAAFTDAIRLDDTNGAAPLPTNGRVIGTDGNSHTIATGIDLSPYTITGDFLLGPSSLFQVTGAGATKTTTLTVTGATVSLAANSALSWSSGNVTLTHSASALTLLASNATSSQLVLKNSSSSAVANGFEVLDHNGNDTIAVGNNNSTDETFVWNFRNSAMNFGTNNTLRGYIGASGGLVWGAPTGGDKGASTFNLAGAFYVNNVQIVSGTGAGAFTTISASGQITSTVSTGTAPLVVSSTTQVANLNAATLGGATFAAPGAIGGTTAAAGTFTTLTGTGGTHTGITSFGLRDTSAAFDVTLAAVSSTTLTAGRTLTLDMGNVAHTLNFGTSTSTVTFPTGTVTLVASTVATLSSLVSIGTITTGVWNAGAVTSSGAISGTTLSGTGIISSTRSDGNYMFELIGSGAGQVTYGLAVTGGGVGNFTIDEVGVAARLTIAKTTGTTTVQSTTDATSTSTGALLVSGGGVVAKRFWIPAITTSSGLQTAVLCQSSGGEMIADSVACLASAGRFKNLHGRLADGALAKLMALPIERWSYKPEGVFASDGWTRERIGPIADDVAAMDERLVGYDGEGRIKTYSTEQLLGFTIKALQELKADNDNLRDEVRQLKRSMAR